MQRLISATEEELIIAAISYCPVISYITSTPFKLIRAADTVEVSDVDATEISVMALVLFLYP
jgi:hypothetical protein